jgi:hypothetical protein
MTAGCILIKKSQPKWQYLLLRLAIATEPYQHLFTDFGQLYGLSSKSH